MISLFEQRRENLARVNVGRRGDPYMEPQFVVGPFGEDLCHRNYYVFML